MIQKKNRSKTRLTTYNTIEKKFESDRQNSKHRLHIFRPAV